MLDCCVDGKKCEKTTQLRIWNGKRDEICNVMLINDKIIKWRNKHTKNSIFGRNTRQATNSNKNEKKYFAKYNRRDILCTQSNTERRKVHTK